MSSLYRLRTLGAFPGRRSDRSGADIAHLMVHPAADPALTLEQAERYSGQAQKTLKGDVARGLLVATRRSADGTIRIRLSDLHRYLDAQRRDYGMTTPPKAERVRDWGA